MNKEFKINDDLILTQVSSERLEEFFKLCQIINSQEMAYLPEMVSISTDSENTLKCLRDYESKFKHTGAPDFFILYQGDIAGVIGFHPWNKGSEVAELAFWVAPNFQRIGIASSVVSFVMSFAFKEYQLKRIELLIEPENEASLKLAIKCNLTQGEDRIEKTKEGSLTYKYFYQSL